ncbi:MAG TPA: polyprenyl synthetase family protein [Aestuariivirgaceae bacterium]|jgi:farnesyl diphosphate synthase
MSFPEALREIAVKVEHCLDEILSPPHSPTSRLTAAMRYAVLGPGKRLRAFLLIETARMFAVPEAQSLRAAAALECFHAYSLVHDDLPAMDDDDMRRGRPACHRAFDEATAILAGDSLQALAFGILAQPQTHPDPAIRARLVALLAEAAGPCGMAGGQMLDLQPGSDSGMEKLLAMMEMKTGALFSFAVDAGSLIGHASDADFQRLHSYSTKFGLAFQIADDILDHAANIEPATKSKPRKTIIGIVDMLGLAGAKAQADALAAEAAQGLAVFGDRAAMLRKAARFIVERQH